jgi:hypothetical protein
MVSILRNGGKTTPESVLSCHSCEFVMPRLGACLRLPVRWQTGRKDQRRLPVRCTQTGGRQAWHPRRDEIHTPDLRLSSLRKQGSRGFALDEPWIPACAGMTDRRGPISKEG